MAKQSKYKIGTILEDGRTIIDIERTGETEYRFLLYCDICKTEKWVKRSSGLNRRCVGCGGKIWKYETPIDKKNNRAFTNYRYRAEKNGKEFSLTRENFLRMISKPCHWCGFDGPVGIDRVNNNYGYTVDNSVPCCKKCNYAKNDMSLDEWYDWLNRIASYRGNLTKG